MTAQAEAVFLHPFANDYVGVFVDDDGEPRWLQWPAEHNGWARRKGCAADLPADLARLALRLSGVEP
jgi:hypothetical protein